MARITSTSTIDYSALHASEALRGFASDEQHTIRHLIPDAQPTRILATPCFAADDETRHAFPQYILGATFVLTASVFCHQVSPSNALINAAWTKGDVLVRLAGRTIEEDRNASLSAEIISYRTLAPGWDGANSKKPSPTAIDEALAFIDMIPLGGKSPEPMAAGDGEVGFYWKTDNGYIDLGFRGTGVISYYARVGGEMAKGLAPFGAGTALPKALLCLIGAI